MQGADRPLRPFAGTRAGDGSRAPSRACYRAVVRSRTTATRAGALRTAGRRLAVTAAVLAAVWWPARPGGDDGFPLSTYPMFGYARAPTSAVDTAQGVHVFGRTHLLTPTEIAGTANPKLALATVQRAVARRQTASLCREIAARVAARPREEQLIAVEVVTETWDTLAAWQPKGAPLERVVHARCGVPRG